jgi:hypothetical protein
MACHVMLPVWTRATDFTFYRIPVRSEKWLEFGSGILSK